MTRQPGRLQRALDGDESLLVTRAVLLDDIHIRSGGTGRDVVAYAAVWNIPAEIKDSDGHYREQNHPESMTRSIAERGNRIFSVYNHGKTLHGTPSERHSVPLGTPLEVKPDSRGLLTVTRYSKDPEAERILEAINNGSLRGMSYTGVFIRSDPQLSRWEQYGADPDGNLPLVTRLEIGLIEYGPTPIPAYEDAEIITVRMKTTDLPPEPDDRETITVQPPPEPAAEEPAAEHDRASVDESSWDGSAAMSACANSDNPAAAYASVCAGRKEGDPDLQSSWALPHHARPNAAPNAAGVRNALSRLPQTQGLTNREAAQRHLESHMSAISGDSTSSSGRSPAPGTERTEPLSHSATTQNRSTTVEPDRETMTVEERAARQSEIRARHAELDAEYSGGELSQEARAEWDELKNEYAAHERAIADQADRAAYLRQQAEVQSEQTTERVDNSRAGYGGAPTVHVRENIYDLSAIRNRARSIDELPMLYRDYAMRAVEQARFPGLGHRRFGLNREDAQERVAFLLDTIDDEHGTLARRILVTGSPTYDRAFGKALAAMSDKGLTAEESRSLSLGTDSAGGYAVPFQLDPTVILSSNGVVNPLRQIARVETITGKEWDGVTSAGVSVARGTEAQEVGTGDPALVQPSVRTTRVQGWVPFSIELDVTWNALRTQLTNILQDAKDVEEATAFATGNGTAPNPNGIVSTLGTASWVDTAGSGALAAADIYLLENAMAPRFIANSSIVASKTTYNRFRTLFQAQASSAGDPFSRPSQAMGEQFNGYPKYELSTMSTTIGTGQLIMLQGDFNQFLIVDRVGMGIELVPQVLGSNRRPTGERGIYALWFNNSKILVDNAFRLLRIKST